MNKWWIAPDLRYGLTINRLKVRSDSGSSIFSRKEEITEVKIQDKTPDTKKNKG